MSREYYPSLDGLRAIAVSIVLLAHGKVPFPKSGGVGVDIFFVLSGFLITSILDAEYQEFKGINFKNFYVRRFLRLYPGLILICVFFAAWQIISTGIFPTKVILISLTYTANWARALYNVNLSSLAHTWSLAIEEQFYLVWPLTILFLNRSVKSPTIKYLILLCGAFGLGAYRFAMVDTYSAERIYFGWDTHIDVIIFGASLYYFLTSLHQRKLSQKWSKGAGYFFAPLSVVGLVGIMATITWVSPWMGRIGYTLAAFFSAVVILDLISGSHSLLGKILSTPALVFIGKISYGLYLWHYPIYHALDSLIPEASLLAPAKIGISVLVATGSYYLIERHFLQLKRHFTREL